MSGRLTRLTPLLLALVMGLSAASTTVPAYAAPAAPTGLTPADTSVAGVPTLQWTPVPHAARYDVEILTGSGTTVASATTVNHRYVPTRRLPSHVQWRVRAVDASNVTGPWSSADLTAEDSPAPVLRSPANDSEPGTGLTQPDNPPLLSWDPVDGAVGYTVEISTDGFITSTPYTTQSTAFVVPKPGADGVYQWRVTADLGNGISSPSSEEWSYRVGTLPRVTTVFPTDDPDFAIEDVVLDWDPVPGAVTYEVWVSTDPDFNNTASTVAKVTGITGTSYSPPKTFLNNQYYWKVRAVNAQKETVDWPAVAYQNFKRNWPDRPTLLHPADQLTPAVSDPFYFEWSPIDHASYYELQVGTDQNFSPGTFHICNTTGTTYTAGYLGADSCMPSQGGVSYWRVRGIDDPAGVAGLYSDIHRFVYDSGRVTQTSPANGATVAVPTLRWLASRDAAKYQVAVTDATGHVTRATTYSLSWTPNLDPVDGPFSWTVRALDANDNPSPLYPGRSFSIAGTPATTAAAPLTPLTGVEGDAPTTEFPSLSWEPQTGAAYYKVSIGNHGSGFFFESTYSSFLTQKNNYPAATDTGDDFLSPGQYDWFVSAYDKNNAPLGSGSVDTFTIDQLAAVSGQRLALTGGSLDHGVACTAALDNAGVDSCSNVPSTPVLDWNPVPGASFYMIYLAQDRELTNPVYSAASTPSTVNTRWTPRLNNSPAALPDSQAGKAYYWFIRPCKTDTICGPDPTSKANAATNAFDKRSPAPVLNAPVSPTAADPVSVANEITFSWQDYLATNQATLFDETGEPSYQSARSYRIEVSSTDTFSTLVDSREVDQTTYTAYDRTYPEGTLYWRVQAIDGDGNHLAWSQVGKFKKDSGKPQLTSPVGNEATDGLMPLRWAPDDFARNYTLEVYANNDDTFSTANLLFRTTTEQTAYAWNRPIPASGSSYLWRVHSNDAGNRPGAWSALGRFRSTGAVPTLVAPASGSYVGPNSGLFSWTAVTGAASYRFERRLSGSVSTAESQLTAATSWAPTRLLTEGSWQWRVTALDAHGAALGTSAWQGFTVDTTRPTVLSLTPTGVVKAGATFAASFSEPVKNVKERTFTIVRKGTTTPLPGNVTLTGTVARLDPSANLKRGQVYVVSLSSRIKDFARNRLVARSWKVKVQ